MSIETFTTGAKGFRSYRYLYEDQLRVTAELDANNNIKKRYVYGNHINVPDYMEYDGKKYLLVKDIRGSVLRVVESETGLAMQEIEYDDWGKIIKDSNPGFQPFGFAGGLYDNDTNLVRFGARDYDSEIGRWTSKDPILFEGGDENLYGYIAQDPINGIDPNGKSAELCIAISLYQTAERIGQLQAKIDAMKYTLSKDSCKRAAEEKVIRALEAELENLSTFKSAYGKCINQDIYTPDQSI